jgi:Neuraminidase (sialidase)
MSTNAALATIDNQIVVTGDGTLVDLFKYGQGSGVQPANLTAIGALRSTDAGQTWSRIIPVADADSVAVRDPDDGDRVRAFTNLEVAADPTKPATIYAVWADARFSGGRRNDIVFSTSSDAGLTWSTPVKISQTPTSPNPLDGQAFLPAIAVTRDGTIGVFYYDFRNNTPDPDTLPTTAYLIHSHDGGQTWQEDQLGAAFDLETAPQSEGYFIGDYQGLAARGNNFLAVFATTNTSLDNRTDLTAVSVSP